MKKRWKVWLAASALSMAIVAGPVAASADDMMMVKPGYSKADVVTKDGVDWVPLRQVAESLGYTVTWHDADRSITLSMTKMGMGMTGKDMVDAGTMDNGMMDKGMTDKGMTDKNIMDNGMTDKNMSDKNMMDNSIGASNMADKNMMNKAMPDKSMSDKDMANNSLMDAYTVMLQIGSMKVTAGGKESGLTFTPVIWNDKTYVTKSFIESMLAPSMTK